MTVPDLHPNPKEFAALAAKHRVVPVWTELVADSETPVTAFAKIAGPEEPAFLSSRPSRTKRADAIPSSVPARNANSSPAARTSRSGKAGDHPLRSSRRPAGRTGVGNGRALRAERLPHFPGGSIGYLSYDAVRYFEPTVPPAPPDGLGLPDLYFSPRIAFWSSTI